MAKVHAGLLEALSTNSGETTEAAELPKDDSKPKAKDKAQDSASKPKPPAGKKAAGDKPVGKTSGAAKPDAKPPKPEPRLLTPPSVEESKRVSLYLHLDDARTLGLMHLEDGADNNARFRAMLAVYRSNDRFKTQVDYLARTAPRGQGRTKK